MCSRATGARAEGVNCTAGATGGHAGGLSCQSNGPSSFVHGQGCIVDTSGTACTAVGVNTSATGYGTIASGASDFANGIKAAGAGSFVTGRVGTGSIQSVFAGSVACGYADSGGTIVSSGNGTIAGGFSAAGSISASFTGSVAYGSCFGGTITASSQGAYASGSSNNSSLIFATGEGAYAQGRGEGGGKLQALGSATFVRGIASGGFITCQGGGGTAFGAAGSGGTIIVTASPSFAFGNALSALEVTRSDASCAMVIERDTRVPSNKSNSLLIGQYGTAVTSVTQGSNTVQGIGSFQIAGGSDTFNRDISVAIGTQTFGGASIGGGISNFWNTCGADYAEYFEWEDGLVDNEDGTAFFVGQGLSNPDKIVIAPNTESVLGVASSSFSNVGIIGDSAELKWKNAILRDTLGRHQFKYSYVESFMHIMRKYNIIITASIETIINASITSIVPHNGGESVQDAEFESFVNLLRPISFQIKIPNDNITLENINDNNYDLYIIKPLDPADYNTMFTELENANPIRVSVPNPVFDPSLTYIPRSKRKEWIPVSLLGKVIVRDNGQCTPGQKCDCLNSIAIPGTMWRVLTRIAPDTIKILFK